MADLPDGLVTFLLTDVEGSTRLWEEEPAAARVAMARHDAIVEEEVGRHGGVVVRPRGEGDSRFCVFARATDALAAAAAAQCAIHRARWPIAQPLRVRMALHTGEAELRGGDYYGAAVNRCARLRAIAHGGQVLLSTATAELVPDDLPDGASLRDLGVHRLRGLQRPERVFQLVAADLPSQFPPLRGLDSRPNNLPIQATPLLGREREAADVRALLLRPDVRLVTLTGPGGTGKTRLALQVAADLLESFEHGSFFVSLAPIVDPELVLPTVARTLGLIEAGDRALADRLGDYLRDRQLLLVLDNFEQVIPAATAVGALIGACPAVKVLVTSREVLQLYGERLFPVPGLLAGAAARLFIERAQAARPGAFGAGSGAVGARSGFAPTDQNAAAIAEICARLDGLPLAIELAAARIRLLSPQMILERLGRRLALLTGGARDLPARHQALRAAIDWSHELLDADEQRLFRRLAVFVDGWTLEAAEAVCTPEAEDLLDGLTRLVDKSLVKADQAEDGGVRYRMLETVREYALEQLARDPEADACHRRHALHFLETAEQGEVELYGPRQGAWLHRLTGEDDNLRAALRWSISRGETEIGLRLGSAMWRFWRQRGHYAEGRDWLERLLAMPGADAPTALRAGALYAAGEMAQNVLDIAAMHTYHEESLAIGRAIGDRAVTARALQSLGTDYMFSGDYAMARDHISQSLALHRELGHRGGIAMNLGQMGTTLRELGDRDGAIRLGEESVALFRDIGDVRRVGRMLNELALSVYERGERERAGALCAESLAIFRELGAEEPAAQALEVVAAVASAHGRHTRAARLLAAAQALREAIGAVLEASWQSFHERGVAAARARLGARAFDRAWTEGRAMDLEQAIADALADDEPGAPEARPEDPLTRREREVAGLLARGLSNREIAEALVISGRTTESHVSSILAKLELASRAQIGVWYRDRAGASD